MKYITDSDSKARAVATVQNRPRALALPWFAPLSLLVTFSDGRPDFGGLSHHVCDVRSHHRFGPFSVFTGQNIPAPGMQNPLALAIPALV
jgi:hypothetical protein